MVPTLKAELAAWKLSRGEVKPTDLVCPPPRRLRKNGTFGAAWGKYLGPKSLKPAFATAFKATGIKAASMYCYGRHSFGSITGLAGGVSAFRLQEIMGHADISTTLHYVNLKGQELTSDELRALDG